MPFTHSVNLGAPSSFSELDMFLQSLTSEESSDADSYDFFSPESQQMRQSFQSTGTNGNGNININGNGYVNGRSQMDSVPQGAFNPQYLNAGMKARDSDDVSPSSVGVSGMASVSIGQVPQDVRSMRSSNGISSLGTSPHGYNEQTFIPQSLPLDQVNSASFGSTSSSDHYNNNSPFDLSDTELKPSITNDTDLVPHVMIKSESDSWGEYNGRNGGVNAPNRNEAKSGYLVVDNKLGPINLTSAAISGAAAAAAAAAATTTNRPGSTFTGNVGSSSSSSDIMMRGDMGLQPSSSPAESNDSRSSHGTIGVGSYGNGTSANGKVGKPKKERTSHNVIEKKYRTNINNKIVQLKEIIPSLCVTMKREEGIPVTELDHLRLDGLQPAKKLNKASILVKTIEYIQHLENHVERLKLENEQLKQGQTFSTPLSVRNNSTSESSNGHQSSSDTTPHYHSGANVSNAYPTDVNASSSFRNKMLLGGLAMTMGANCFNGDSSDFQTVRGLMAMPVFHYSPMNGFTVSNSNGNINVFSSFLSLFRLGAFFFIIFYLVTQLISEKQSSKPQANVADFVVDYVDSLKFNSNSNIVETLKKTLFINKLKYPENSMERLENEIMKCFAIKLWKSPFKILVSNQVEKTWSSLTKKVNDINEKSKDGIDNQDWKAITNILEASIEETLGNETLLSKLTESKDGFNLSSFVQFVNSSIINQKVESVINDVFLVSCEDDESAVSQIDDIFKDSVKGNKEFESLGLTPILDCIFHPSNNHIKELTDKLKVEKSSLDADSKNDIVRILHSCIISSLISEKKFYEVSYWVNRIPLSLLDENLSILSVFSLYIAIKKVLDNHENIEDISKISAKLEYISGKLRIWIGSNSGNTLQLDTRGKLVDFFVDSALKFNSLVGSDDEEDEDHDDVEYDLDDEEDGDLFDDDDNEDLETDQTELGGKLN